LGQLAGFGQQGLQMAMGIQGNQQAQERQAKADALAAEERAYGRKRDEVTDARAEQEWEMKLTEYKKTLTAEEAAKEAAALENAAKMALTAETAEQWDQLAQENGAPELVGQFDNREAVAARFMSMAEVMKAQNPEPPKPTASQSDYNFYVEQETAAGRQPLSFNQWDLQSKKAGASTTTVNTGAVSTDGTPKVGVSLAEIQTSVQSATDLIDDIMEDPALPKVTGSWMGGGGNNVDEFGTARAMAYGDDGLAVVQKIAQLQNTAWLAARDMLKGGGAITDYESKKAEGAMARLSRRQGDKEFAAALKDLKDAITEGARKLKEANALPSGAADPNSPPAGEPSEIDLLMQGP
jgi:hypothetical protein